MGWISIRQRTPYMQRCDHVRITDQIVQNVTPRDTTKVYSNQNHVNCKMATIKIQRVIENRCVIICVRKFDLEAKHFPQTSQLNGFSPVWTRACLTTSDDRDDAYEVVGQYPQKYHVIRTSVRQPRQTPRPGVSGRLFFFLPF